MFNECEASVPDTLYLLQVHDTVTPEAGDLLLRHGADRAQTRKAGLVQHSRGDRAAHHPLRRTRAGTDRARSEHGNVPDMPNRQAGRRFPTCSFPSARRHCLDNPLSIACGKEW